MDWKKGLLRAWVLISALWLVISVPYQGADLVASRPETLEEFYERHSTSITAPPPAELDFEIRDGRKYRSIDPTYKFENPEYKKWKDEVLEIKAKRGSHDVAEWGYRGGAALFIFAPPLAVLLLGVGVFWVASGFRAKQT
jgi:hypothetical protein